MNWKGAGGSISFPPEGRIHFRHFATRIHLPAFYFLPTTWCGLCDVNSLLRNKVDNCSAFYRCLESERRVVPRLVQVYSMGGSPSARQERTSALPLTTRCSCSRTPNRAGPAVSTSYKKQATQTQ